MQPLGLADGLAPAGGDVVDVVVRDRREYDVDLQPGQRVEQQVDLGPARAADQRQADRDRLLALPGPAAHVAHWPSTSLRAKPQALCSRRISTADRNDSSADRTGTSTPSSSERVAMVDQRDAR